MSAPAALFQQFNQDVQSGLLVTALQHNPQSSAELVDPYVVRGVRSKWQKHFRNWPHLARRRHRYDFLLLFFFWLTATKHFTSLLQRFVLRAVSVQMTSNACCVFLFLPTFNVHLQCSFFFAPRVQFLHSFSTSLSALRTSQSPFFVSLLLLVPCGEPSNSPFR